MPTLNLTCEEWRTLRVWMDEHGYTAQRDEPLDAWQGRTAPVSYVYALIIEAGCEHALSAVEPYCAVCGALMEG